MRDWPQGTDRASPSGGRLDEWDGTTLQQHKSGVSSSLLCYDKMFLFTLFWMLSPKKSVVKKQPALLCPLLKRMTWRSAAKTLAARSSDSF